MKKITIINNQEITTWLPNDIKQFTLTISDKCFELITLAKDLKVSQEVISDLYNWKLVELWKYNGTQLFNWTLFNN